MAMSEEVKAKFRERMAAELGKNREADVQTEADVEEAIKADFEAVPEVEAGEHEQMFGELFFDPQVIGCPDFPVPTYFHLHDEWPECVRNDVPVLDPHYVWNQQVTYDAVLGLIDGHQFLVGPPGSGKTTLPEQIAAVVGRPLFKQSFSHDLEKDEWLASKEITEKGTSWDHKGLVRSMLYPYICVLDEFNRLIRGGRLLMNPLLDENGRLQLPSGEEITPHPEWRAVATDNTRGLGDGLDKFDGDVADISTTDRFGQMHEVGYLPREQQVELLKSWYPAMTDAMAADIVIFGERVVTGYNSGVFPLPWTPRRMKAAGRKALQYRNPVKAIKVSYFNFLAEDKQKQACNQALKDTGLDKKYGEFA